MPKVTKVIVFSSLGPACSPATAGFIFYSSFFPIQNSMSESSLTWTFDPPEADKCLLASGEFDVHPFIFFYY